MDQSYTLYNSIRNSHRRNERDARTHSRSGRLDGDTALIEEIKNINEYCKIIVLSTYFPYYDLESHALEELQNFFNTFNDELEQLCKDSNASYLDISLLGKSNYFLESTYTINDAGHQYLGNKIYQCAIDEIC